MRKGARAIRFRPNQAFYINVDGKVESYKFVRATYTYNGSVGIVAKPAKSDLLITLIAERGYIRREFKKTEKGGTYGNCCIFSAFDRHQNIVHWCGIYFSRRTAKKGISTRDLWKQDYREIHADSMSKASADIEAMMSMVRVITEGPIDAMLIDDLTGKRERVVFQPSHKMKDFLNMAVTASQNTNTTGSTHPDAKVPTYADLKAMADQLKEVEFVRPDPKDPMFWPDFQIRNSNAIINIKGGV